MIARGGMGVVYEAYDPHLDRIVALKVLPHHLDSTQSRARFQREVQSAARLEHPHIVPVYDSGEAHGLRYYAMQYIEGRGLDLALAEVRAQSRDSVPTDFKPIPLLAQAARALEFAHQNGVLHRDIKPSNLIVDQAQKIYLADFGLSKSRDWEDLTGTHDVVGTLRYLAPERFAGEGDARSDVYALGLVLYEALTLEPAIRSKDRAAVVQEITGELPIPPRRWDPSIPRDLETIVLTAIHPSPGARYSSAGALADDLEAFLDHRPIRARRPGPARRVLLAARRNRRLTATIAVAVSLLIASSITYLVSVNRWVEQTRSLALARSASEAIPRDAMLGLLLARQAVEAKRDPTTLSTLARALAALHEYACLEGHESEVRWCRAVDRVLISRSLQSLRIWHSDGRFIRAFESDQIIQAAISCPKTGAIAFTSSSGLNYHPGGWTNADTPASTTPILLQSPVTTLAFEPTGGLLIATWDGTVYRWTSESGLEPWLRRDQPVSALLVSPSGNRVVIETWTDEFFCVDRDGTLIWSNPEPLSITHRRWSSDEEHLSVASGSRAFVLRSDGSVRCELKGHEDVVEDLAFSPDGQSVLTGSTDQTARLWSLDGRERQRFAGHGSSLESVAFHPDGRRVLTISTDQSAKLWSVEGDELLHFTGHDDSLIHGSFSVDGESVITTSADRTLRLWRLQPKDFTTFRGHEGGLYTAEFSPEGTHVLTASRDQSVRIWSREGRELKSLPHASYVCAAAYSRNGESIVVTTMRNMAHHYDSRGNRLAQFQSPRMRVLCAWNEGNERRYLVRTEGGGGAILDDRGREKATLPAHPPYVWFATYDPERHQLMTTSGNGVAKIWDASNGEAIRSLQGHEDLVRSFAVSPVEDLWVTAGDDGTARIWSGKTESIAVLRGHDGPVLMASFSPDGTRVVTASRDGTARVWSVTGELQLVLSGHQGVLWSAQFSPDGRQVITASFDQTARTWLVDEEDLIRAANTRATRDLTPTERREYGELLMP